jgi:hypothetical protein
MEMTGGTIGAGGGVTAGCGIGVGTGGGGTTGAGGGGGGLFSIMMGSGMPGGNAEPADCGGTAGCAGRLPVFFGSLDAPAAFRLVASSPMIVTAASSFARDEPLAGCPLRISCLD